MNFLIIRGYLITPNYKEISMFFDFTVPIAAIVGNKVIQKIGKNLNVLFEVDRVYDPQKKVTLPKRVCIGRVCEFDHSLMNPNENFLNLFPGYPIPEDCNSSDRSCCLKVGAYIAIKKVIKEQGLDTMLESVLHEDAGLFMDLMSYLIVNEDNAGQYYPDYAHNHPLFSPDMKIFSDASVSRLFQRITVDQIISFLDAWNSVQDHRQRIYISYDSTNKNCQAGDIEILEMGHAKDDKGLPIFNTAVAYNCTNQKPLFYELYPGSICDVSQLKYLVDKVKAYNYKSVGFVLDRGYFSRSNIQYMDQNNYHFIMMVKGCKLLVSSIIEDRKGTFEEERNCHIKSTTMYGVTVKAPLFPGDKDRYFCLYYKPERAAQERGRLEKKLEEMTAALQESIGHEIFQKGIFESYFNLTLSDENVLLDFEENADAIKQELKLCGYFCIISSEDINPTDAYFLYKGRDPSEKLFRADKTYLGSRSMRVQSRESLSAKTWLEFTALIVRNRIYNLLKDEMLRLNIKKNYMTVPAAMKELDKIEMIRRNKEFYRLDHAVTKNQQTILRSFGLDINDIRSEAAIITERLVKANKTKNVESENDDGKAEIDEEFGYEDFDNEI